MRERTQKKKRVRKIRILLVVKCAAVKLVGHLGFSSIPCWWSLGAKWENMEEHRQLEGNRNWWWQGKAREWEKRWCEMGKGNAQYHELLLHFWTVRLTSRGSKGQLTGEEEEEWIKRRRRDWFPENSSRSFLGWGKKIACECVVWDCLSIINSGCRFVRGCVSIRNLSAKTNEIKQKILSWADSARGDVG